jgi:hypothetical protein
MREGHRNNLSGKELIINPLAGAFDRYEPALTALSEALNRKAIAGAFITGYWQKNNKDLPDWEREFDSKFANMFEMILGMAKAYGLEPYLEEFFTAVNESADGMPDIEKFLPWQMSASMKRRCQPKPLKSADVINYELSSTVAKVLMNGNKR